VGSVDDICLQHFTCIRAEEVRKPWRNNPGNRFKDFPNAAQIANSINAMEMLHWNFWGDCTLSLTGTRNMEVVAACKIYSQSQASESRTIISTYVIAVNIYLLDSC
jgi:hypothetical protein